jgi:hypothetical protein
VLWSPRLSLSMSRFRSLPLVLSFSLGDMRRHSHMLFGGERHPGDLM